VISYKGLFTALFRHKIQYLVAGGVAVNLHQVNRATADLDLIVHLETKNVHSFIKVMENLGYKPKLPVKTEDLADPEKRKEWIQKKNMVVFSYLNPKNPFEIVDIFVQEPKPFSELEKNKLEVQAFGITIPVLGIGDLIEIKQKTGRDTDLFDVQQLKKIKQ